MRCNNLVEVELDEKKIETIETELLFILIRWTNEKYC